jgi:hypothetical protein
LSPSNGATTTRAARLTLILTKCSACQIVIQPPPYRKYSGATFADRKHLSSMPRLRPSRKWAARTRRLARRWRGAKTDAFSMAMNAARQTSVNPPVDTALRILSGRCKSVIGATERPARSFCYAFPTLLLRPCSGIFVAPQNRQGRPRERPFPVLSSTTHANSP